MNEQKEYVGSCFVAVVGSENEIGECRDSIESIRLRQGDTAPVFIRGTKGYETRNIAFEKWLEKTQHPFMLLLDHDMIFPPDTLERLRAHRRPYVSGYYLRRRYSPMAPVWFEKFTGWPVKPYVGDPERGKLHDIGASGWGCVLVHRDVALAVKAMLHGEALVLEDDMDIWPYNVKDIIGAVRTLRTLTTEEDLELKERWRHFNTSLKVLENQFRLLRGSKSPVGSDIRFPFYAKKAGYQLYLDTSVLCGHMLNYNLQPSDFMTMPTQTIDGQDEAMQIALNKEKERLNHTMKNVRIASVTRDRQKPVNVAPQGSDEREQVNNARISGGQGGTA